MKILHQNATPLLFEKVKSLGPNPASSWRCIHVHLSNKPERYNHGLREHFVARTLIERLADLDGYMFLCNDGDIFILFQGPLKRVIGKLDSHFDEFNGDFTHAQPEDSRFTIYDLSAGWHSLMHVCQVKALEALEAPEGFYSAFAYSSDLLLPQV